MKAIRGVVIQTGLSPVLLMCCLAAAAVCFGQTTSQPLVPGTVVTGHCQGNEHEPGCVLPNLFGPQGLTLFPSPQFSHFAHFSGSAQTTLNQTLSTAIATQLAILPIISPASGFTYEFDRSLGVFVRSGTSFGPIYTERAETIGRGRFSFGVSYQRFRFSTLDGIDLHNMPAVFSHIPDTGPNASPEPYEADVIRTTNNISLNMDQTMLYGTVGITNRVDVSLAVPIVSVRMGADSNATIVRVSGPQVTVTTPAGSMVINNPHQFTADPNSLFNVYTSNGSAAGIGDVTIRAKANIFRKESIRVAVLADLRIPSGDARKFLGSGATGIKPFVAISGTGRISPHLNLGYQWNGKSILAGNITGASIAETTDATNPVVIQNGPVVKQSLPDLFFYSAGVDSGVTKRLTVSFDYLGQVLFDAPRVFRTNFLTQNLPGGTGTLTIPTITAGKDTIGYNSGAAGLKYNLFGNLLLSANLLFRLGNQGLRQDVTPLIALSYAFGR